MTMKKLIATLILTWIFLVTSSCKKAGIKVEGVLIDSGRAFIPKPGHHLEVRLYPKDSSAPLIEAQCTNDGHFEAHASPGKYRITIRYIHRDRDTFKGKYSNESSLIQREIVKGGDKLIIDLGNPDNTNASLP